MSAAAAVRSRSASARTVFLRKSVVDRLRHTNLSKNEVIAGVSVLKQVENRAETAVAVQALARHGLWRHALTLVQDAEKYGV